MAKITEATLRVRAQNLASKDLGQVSSELDNLTTIQKKNTDAIELAKKSTADLKDQLKALQTIAKDLQSRGVIAQGLAKDKAAIGDMFVKLQGLRQQLDSLNATKATGTKVAGLGTEIGKVSRQIASIEKQLTTQVTKFEQSGKAAQSLGINAARTAESIVAINVEAGRTNSLINETVVSMGEFNNALRLSREALLQQQKYEQDITAEAQRRNLVETQAAAQRREEAQQLKNQLEQQAAIRDELTGRFLAKSAPSQLAPALAPAGDPEAVEMARSNGVRERLIALLARQKDGGEKLLSNDKNLVAATNEVTSANNRNSESLDRNFKASGLFSDTGRKSLSVYQRLRGQILSTTAAYVGLFQTVNLVRSAIEVQQNRLGIAIKFKIADNDDPARAGQDLKFVRDEADRLGQSFETLATHYVSFKVGARAAGLTQLETNKMFTQATEIITGFRLPTEDADRAFLAFTQILGKNKVMAQELTQQLGNALPGAVALFSQSLVAAGKVKTLSDVPKYIAAGKASIADFQNFLAKLDAQVHDAAIANSHTLISEGNRLTNVYHDFLVQLANAGTSDELLKVVDELISKLQGDSGAKFAKELGGAFEDVGKILLFVIDHFDELLTLLKGFALLNAAKAIVDIGGSLLNTGVSAVTAVSNLAKFGVGVAGLRAASIAAAEGTTALTLGMRGLYLITGPVGIAIASATALLAAFVIQAKNASDKLEDFQNENDRLRNLKRVGDLDQLTDAKKAIDAEIVALDALKKHRQELADADAKEGDRGFLAPLTDTFNGHLPSVESLTDLDDAIKAKQLSITSRLAAIRGGIQNIEGVSFVETQQAIADRAEIKKPIDTPAVKDKGEDRRLNLAKEAADQLLGIEKQLSQARLEVAVSTQQQITDNYEEQLSIIKTGIEKQTNDLKRLRQEAVKAKSADAVKSVDAALSDLPALQKELEAKLAIETETKRIELSEKNITDLINTRNQKQDAVNALVTAGLLTEVEGREKVNAIQDEYGKKITDAIEKFRIQVELLKDSNPDLAKALHLDDVIAKMQQAEIEARKLDSSFDLVKKNFAQNFSQGIAEGIGTFIKGITGGIEGVNGLAQSFKNAKNAFLDFLANFLVGIAQAVLQAILLEAILRAFGLGHPDQSYASIGISAITKHHTGGVAGSGIRSTSRMSNALFAGAPRFHNGGLPGLSSDEIPAILKKREEVLTEDDPRNVLNGGGMGGGRGQPIEVAIHNSIDPAEMMEAAANTKRGQKAIFNAVTANAPQFRKLLAS